MNENNYSLKNVVGLDDVKKTLYDRLVRYYQKKSEYEKYGTTPEKGMLIASIPGCGKSMVLKAIKNDYKDSKNIEIMQIQHGMFMRGAVGATSRAIHRMFDNIRNSEKDVVLLMDELDNLFPVRGTSGVLARERTTAFLEEFDGQFDDDENKIFVIGATNQPHDIDPAVMRNGRLGRLVVVSPPNDYERKLLFRSYLKRMIKDYSIDVDLKTCRKAIVQQTNGYVGADFKAINRELRHTIENKEDNGEKPILTYQDIALYNVGQRGREYHRTRPVDESYPLVYVT